MRNRSDGSVPPSTSTDTATDVASTGFKVAIVYHGAAGAQAHATPANSKVPAVFAALVAAGIDARPVIWCDEAYDQVRALLAGVDGILVWVNPIEAGRDRTRLDALLREIAARGVLVSAHPDTILKIGTKEVLYRTRTMSWGDGDTRLHATPADMRDTLAMQLTAGQTRVLKQYRGHSGDGVWKVEPAGSLARVRHARRGSPEELMSLDAFAARCADYFTGDGRMINQTYQPRLPEGMIRCYLVGTQVAGFGHQAVNALCPPAPGAAPGEFPPTTPRLYHPATLPAFQDLRRRLEQAWLPELMTLAGLGSTELPLLWDCDFLLGARGPDGSDGYVLCEINVSSVSPFPESTLEPLARGTLARLAAARAATRP